MPHIHGTGTQQHRAHTHVHDIILVLRLQVLFSLHIVPFCLVDDKAVHQRLDILLHSFHIDLPAGGGHRVCDFLCRELVSDVVKDESGDALQHHRVWEPMPYGDVLDYNGIVDTLKIVTNLLRLSRQVQRIRERAVFDIRPVFPGKVLSAPRAVNIFPEGKRQHGDLHMTTGQQCGNVARQHFGVGASDIQINIFPEIKAVQYAGEFLTLLDFIQEDIRHLAVN